MMFPFFSISFLSFFFLARGIFVINCTFIMSTLRLTSPLGNAFAHYDLFSSAVVVLRSRKCLIKNHT